MTPLLDLCCVLNQSNILKLQFQHAEDTCCSSNTRNDNMVSPLDFLSIVIRLSVAPTNMFKPQGACLPTAPHSFCHSCFVALPQPVSNKEHFQNYVKHYLHFQHMTWRYRMADHTLKRIPCAPTCIHARIQ